MADLKLLFLNSTNSEFGYFCIFSGSRNAVSTLRIVEFTVDEHNMVSFWFLELIFFLKFGCSGWQ